MKEKGRVVKSLNFYAEDLSLLLWAEGQGMPFSDFVKGVLSRAHEGGEAPAVDYAKIRAIIRAELSGLSLAQPGQAPGPGAEGEADSALISNLVDLF